MARVTIEDCIEKINNQFELVLVASKRARQLENGAQPELPVERDKPTVLALREIAEGAVTREKLEEQEAREASEAMAAEAAEAAEEAAEKAQGQQGEQGDAGTPH